MRNPGLEAYRHLRETILDSPDRAMQNKSGFEDGASRIVSRRGRCETRVLTPSRVVSFTGRCDFPSTELVRYPVGQDDAKQIRLRRRIVPFVPATHCLSRRTMRSRGLRFGRRYLTVGQGDNKSGFEDSPPRMVSRRGRCETPVLTSSRVVSCRGRCINSFCQDFRS